jgi:hypothetical protein
MTAMKVLESLMILVAKPSLPKGNPATLAPWQGQSQWQSRDVVGESISRPS